MRIDYILGIPKSLYFCFRSLPMDQAIKLPILVNRKTKFKNLSGKVVISSGKIKTGMIRFGFTGSGTASFMPIVIENLGIMELGENVRFGGGCQICTNKNGRITIGENTEFTGECHIVSDYEIYLGSNCLVSWNTQIMDTDFHKILVEDKICNQPDKVYIGDHCWICSRVLIGKGVHIDKENVIASGSTILKSFNKSNCIFAGMPIRIVKENIDWKS